MVALLAILCYDRIQYVPAGQLMFLIICYDLGGKFNNSGEEGS